MIYYFHYNLPPSSFDEDTFSSPTKTFNQVYEGLTDAAVVGPNDEASSLTLTTPSSMSILNDLFGNSPPSWTVATWDDEPSDDCWRVSGGTWQLGGTVGGLDSAKTYNVVVLAPNPNSGRTISLRVNGGTEQQFTQTNDASQAPREFQVSGVTSIELQGREISGGSVYVKSWYIEEVTPAADTTPPTFASAPEVTNTTDSGHSIGTTLSEPGTVYGIRMTNGATPPADDTEFMALYDGGVTGDVLEVKSASASNSATLVFSTGSAGTAYDYYILAEDDEGTPNVQASPTLVEATTAASQVPGIGAITVQKDGTAVQASDWSINITLVSGGTEVYSGSSIASDASGVISAINASSGSVGDAVRVEGYSASNNYGFVFAQNLEDNA